MEPEDVAEYARQEYWNDRYSKEVQYDWFSSVYGLVLDKIVAVAVDLYTARGSEAPMTVLHLGCGNSALCKDLKLRCADFGIELQQTAIDYSAVVISNMRALHREDLGDSVKWVQADVRSMPEVLPAGGVGFDLIIDKGTMDALQADKNSPTLDEDIEAMLREVSRLLRPRESEGKGLKSVFVQVTWEIPYFRFHHTKRENYPWGIGEGITTCKLGDSDLYRFYRYDVGISQAIESTHYIVEQEHGPS
jgi:ubiquinone/menaquinone biosynthesis C-methylase UbiE